VLELRDEKLEGIGLKWSLLFGSSFLHESGAPAHGDECLTMAGAGQMMRLGHGYGSVAQGGVPVGNLESVLRLIVRFFR